MLRREFLAAAAPAALRAAAQRPNILWLMTDEQRPDSLRCYGSPWAHSPHMDDLASAGVLFRNAYVPAPVCVACRSALLTGNAASTNRVLHNQARLQPGTRLLTWRFEDAGYQTASFGKKHYFLNGGRQAFQREAGKATDSVVDAERYGEGYDPSLHDVVQYSPSPDQKERRRWILAGKFPAREEETAEARNVALALHWLNGRDVRKPFLLRLSLNAPHTPVVVPPEYLKRIDPDRIALPVPTEAELQHQPQRERVHLRGFEGSGGLTPDQLRKARHYYYARAAFADAMIGRLLEWMRTRNLLDNTVVVMTSDHGAHLGDHGLLQKQTFYEQVVTVPFVFWSKDRIRPSLRLDTPVNTLSMLPTLLALAGLPSGDVEAPSLARSVTTGSEPRLHPIFSEIAFGYQGYRDSDRQVMVRDGDLKLTLFTQGTDPDAALYDLRRDPAETVNVAASVAYAKDVRRLRGIIEEWDRQRAR